MTTRTRHCETSAVANMTASNKRRVWASVKWNKRRKKMVDPMNERTNEGMKWKRVLQNELRFDCPSYKIPIERIAFLFRVLTNLLLQFYLTSRLLNYIIIIIIMTNVLVCPTTRMRKKIWRKQKNITLKRNHNNTSVK